MSPITPVTVNTRMPSSVLRLKLHALADLARALQRALRHALHQAAVRACRNLRRGVTETATLLPSGLPSSAFSRPGTRLP